MCLCMTLQVTCEVLEQEPVEREEEEMQLQAADLASQVAEADAAQVSLEYRAQCKTTIGQLKKCCRSALVLSSPDMDKLCSNNM